VNGVSDIVALRLGCYVLTEAVRDPELSNPTVLLSFEGQMDVDRVLQELRGRRSSSISRLRAMKSIFMSHS